MKKNNIKTKIISAILSAITVCSVSTMAATTAFAAETHISSGTTITDDNTISLNQDLLSAHQITSSTLLKVLEETTKYGKFVSPLIGGLLDAFIEKTEDRIEKKVPEVTAVTLRTAILAVSKLPSLPFLSSLLLREGVLHNHALTQLQLREPSFKNAEVFAPTSFPEVTAVTLRTAILAVSKLPSLPFLSSLLLREGVLHNHALTQLQLRQAERPAVRRTQKAGQKPGTHFYIIHGGNNYGK